MFFANMFCYGSDLTEVGITGIRGCMGVVYRSPTRLYAVHIPPMSNASNKLGADTFANYIQQTEGQGGVAGDLFFFLAGTTRSSALSEAHHLKSLLGPNTATLFRIMTGLGAGSGTDHAENSPSVLVADRGFISLQYKCVPDNQYVAGGANEAGQYMGQAGGMGSNKVPSDYQNPQGWTTITGANCYRVSIR